MNYYNAEKSSYCKKEHCSETSAAFLLGVKKLKNVLGIATKKWGVHKILLGIARCGEN